ncbi:MAG TPA: LysR family transcriptional regulator [Polyangiaceae bacterium]|nr:LysR family transcriptional regulator [Polyangiaceae bacterium]
MDLNEILVFTHVARTGSFTAAARELSMPKSTVSRKVAELERRLGARLLQRTTRRLSLTDVGRTYYLHASRVVAEIEEAELAVTRMQELPRGLLRVAAPMNFGYLGPALAAFLDRYPEVELEIVCGDRIVDLVEEGFDVAIRAGRLADSTLVARSLGSFRSYVVAAPQFLEKHGAPGAPEELERLDCLVFGAGADRATWRLQGKSETLHVNVRPRMVVNDFDFLVEAALGGVGIALLPVFRCVDAIRQKRLSRVLPDWCSTDIPVHAVYPSTRQLSPKVKAFLEHLVERFTPPPWELGPTP